MRKIIHISVLLLIFLPGAGAQQKVISADTALLQKEEQIAAPVDDDQHAESTTANPADAAVQESENEKADTTLHPNHTGLPYDSIRNWKNLKEYAYLKDLDSLLKNKKKTASTGTTPRPPGSGFLSRFLHSSWVSLVLWMLAIFLILFLSYRLFLAEGVFQRKSRAVKHEGAEVEEELITKESDFDAHISSALQSGSYRQAVRYQYLRTLHLLADKNFIELAPDKTNFQYVREIADRGHQLDFASLTLHYEYVWYGEFNIEKGIYQKMEIDFIRLNQKL